jgi:hypothetical protein
MATGDEIFWLRGATVAEARRRRRRPCWTRTARPRRWNPWRTRSSSLFCFGTTLPPSWRAGAWTASRLTCRTRGPRCWTGCGRPCAAQCRRCWSLAYLPPPLGGPHGRGGPVPLAAADGSEPRVPDVVRCCTDEALDRTKSLVNLFSWYPQAPQWEQGFWLFGAARPPAGAADAGPRHVIASLPHPRCLCFFLRELINKNKIQMKC